MGKSLIEIVENFKGINVGVLGDVMLDHSLFGVIERLNPENSASHLVKITGQNFMLGGAANVAANVKSLGAKSTVYGLVGGDNQGDKIKELCGAQGIKYYFGKCEDTIVKQRVFSGNHYISRNDFGEISIKPIDGGYAQEISDQIFSGNNFDVIILSDYQKGLFLNDFGERIIAEATRRKIKTFTAPKPNTFQKFKEADVLCLNHNEGLDVIGRKNFSAENTMIELKKLSCDSQIYLTCGEGGIVVYDGGIHTISTRARKLSEVTGAGDTVLSALALSLYSEASYIQAAKIANYAAGIAVEKTGTSTLTSEELIARIKEDLT